MKKMIFCILTMLLVLACFLPVYAEATGEPSYIIWWMPESLPTEGDTQISLILQTDATNLQAGVFAEDENLAASVTVGNRRLTISLTRALKEGETVLIVAEGTDDESLPRQQGIYSVYSPFSGHLAALRLQVDQMWESWTKIRKENLEQGIFIVPHIYREVSFLTWPDEAPEIRVTENGNHAAIYVEDQDLDGWRICLGQGIPVVYTDCVWDEGLKAYTAEGPFDSVYLISDMGEERIGITICYERENGFLADYPQIEWVKEEEGGPIGFACYGWGTPRRFDGGMYIIINPEHIIVAEYSGTGALASYTDQMTECTYTNEDMLLYGEEPEGYVNPVIH